MRKVRFLLALSTLLVISIVIILIICLRRPHEPTTTLKVVLNGPYVIVREISRPDMITVFSPRDPHGHHRFYANDLEHGTDQNVHITVAADGLKPGTNLPDLPIDPYFPKDFVVNTEVWQRPPQGDPGKDYMVTIELPLPTKITFVPGLHPVTFEDGTQSLQATNFVLEYQVTDSSKILPQTSGSSGISPLSSSELQAKFDRTVCAKADVHQNNYQSCIEIRNLLEQCAGAKTQVLFFGVGIPSYADIGMSPTDVEVHAVEFFNLMLQSFPHLTGKRLAPKGYAPQGTGGSTAMLMEASYRPAAPHPPLLLPVTAVIDCKAGNVVVTAQTTTTQQ